MTPTKITALVACVSLLAMAPRGRPAEDPIREYLRTRGTAPYEYVLSKLTQHRVVIVGEAHWIRHDAQLVAGLVPALQAQGVDLAAEFFPASEQAAIDVLLSGATWDARAANAVMRAGNWPYREYRDILEAVWSANRRGGTPIRVIALNPGEDWRATLLPRGLTYDSFMAEKVASHLAATKRRILVYCGIHHAFTRYHQAELDLKGRAMSYMDRTGNILWRRFGAQVFLIALHKPWWCGSPEKPSYCLPFDGVVDCAAAAQGKPVGFDVVGSPLAALSFAPTDYYAYGHPHVRFVDYTDGYVWRGPLESFALTTLIPRSEYAPGAAERTQVAHQNPFTDDKDVSMDRLEEIWRQEGAAHAKVLAKRGWTTLATWRAGCKPPEGERSR